ncbi:hypothetical protein MFIFM68171_06695 [Madurella fahalii]|uniref:Protein kinase domain-containing protein n=1 Tax=Madurella fahalii TaxID=1157608 RepID=A0ABQ0GFZ8_9PEZI
MDSTTGDEEISLEKHDSVPPDGEAGPTEGDGSTPFAESPEVMSIVTMDYDIDTLGERSRPAQDRTLTAQRFRTTTSTTRADQILGYSLRSALVEPAGGNGAKPFLPRDAFDRIVTADKIFELLQAYLPLKSSDELQQLTKKINEPTCIELNKSNTSSSRRIIFALLVLIDKIHSIEAFIDHGLYDCHLPLDKETTQGKPVLVSGSNHWGAEGGKSKLVLSGWLAHDLETFHEKQWQFLAPFLSLATQSKPEAEHREFSNFTILPFVEDYELNMTNGGYSDVWRVRIHPAHHNHVNPNHSGYSNPSFAIKRLRANTNSDAFNREVSNLKRLSKERSPHLVDLLLTYYYKGCYHLVFRWASGNMKDFWEKKSADHGSADRRWDLARWAVKQCLGVTKGLQAIHITTPNDTMGPSDAPIYGRHGDLKPENILWFGSEREDGDDPSSFGDFVLSDFGLTEFHRLISKDDVDAASVGRSPTYRAPEGDVRKTISQQYDIWSLGCVLLEFAVWSLKGWDGVDQFSQKRTDEEKHLVPIPEDKFFLVFHKDDEHSGKGVAEKEARLKKSVKEELAYLRAEAGMTQFLTELLDLIEHGLLIIEPSKRSSCSEIVERLESMRERCQNDQEYCTRKPPYAPASREQTSSTPSEISSSGGSNYREPAEAQMSTSRVPNAANVKEFEQNSRSRAPSPVHGHSDRLVCPAGEGLDDSQEAGPQDRFSGSKTIAIPPTDRRETEAGRPAVDITGTVAGRSSLSHDGESISTSNRHGNPVQGKDSTTPHEAANTALDPERNPEPETGPPASAPAAEESPNGNLKIRLLCRRVLCCC